MKMIPRGPLWSPGRWLLVPLLLGVTFFVVFVLGIVALDVADSFCPERYVVSDTCAAPWSQAIGLAVIYGCMSCYAFLWVVIGSSAAPLPSQKVAPWMFMVGIPAAALMAEGYLPWIGATMVGGAAGWWAVLRWTRQEPEVGSTT